MELKAKLDKPYTEPQRIDFIVNQNHKLGYEIKETETALEAWGATDAELLNQAKASKNAELTACRDKEEYANVATDKGEFEFDALSQTRLTNAMNSMNATETRNWTTADGNVVEMAKADFKAIFSKAAVKSDDNFAKLKQLKQQVAEATTIAEVEAIEW